MDKENVNKKLKDHNREYSEYMTWLDSAKEKDKEYFHILRRAIPLFIEFSQKHPHKKTLLTLLTFQTTLSFIRNGLIVLSEDDNFYSASALYRVYLEHWLKGTYILGRYTIEKNDNVGIEYNSIGRIGEELKYGNSMKQVSEILNAETKNLDTWDALCGFDSNLKKFDKKEVIKNIKKFEYKNMAKYIVDNKIPGSDWAHAFFSDYAELSSFVHGGPSTLSQQGLVSSQKIFEKHKGMIRFSFNTCRAFSYLMFSLIVKSSDPKAKDMILPLLTKLQNKEDILF